MKTLHLITQEGQPYGSVRRCCNACGVMLPLNPTAFDGELWTDDPRLHTRAQAFTQHEAWLKGRGSIVLMLTACDRPPIAFKKWNDRPWHIEGNWGHDPGDEDAAR